MKLVNFIFLGILFFLIACEAAESRMNPKDGATLIGTWEAQSFTTETEDESDTNGTKILTTFDIEGLDFDYTLTLTETAYKAAGSYSLLGEVISDGHVFPVDISYTDFKGEGTYTVIGDEITSDGIFFGLFAQAFDPFPVQEEVTATIEKLTEDEVIFVQDSEKMFTREIEGVTSAIISKRKARSVWKRQ